jgi:hypothetical protein
MIELPSLLPYLWVTKVEGIFKGWVLRVIESRLVGEHFALTALCSVLYYLCSINPKMSLDHPKSLYLIGLNPSSSKLQ